MDFYILIGPLIPGLTGGVRGLCLRKNNYVLKKPGCPFLYQTGKMENFM